MQRVIEASYPITFRKHDAERLGRYIQHNDSVMLIGMKRVGISNFLRFFLHHADVPKIYIRNSGEHLIIPVDLNDLVERDIFPFWTLLLKRITDAVESSDAPEVIKEHSRKLFTESIQLKDLFVTVDSVRKIMISLVEAGKFPVIFLLRFDRLQNAFSAEFFSNLYSIREAAHHAVSYVFTSFRSLNSLAPEVFKKPLLSLFAQDMYLVPADKTDMQSILATLEQRYHTQLSTRLRRDLIEAVGGYVQYLQLALIRLHEETELPKKKKELFDLLSKDEQLLLQSEELYESLNHGEKEALRAIAHGKPLDASVRKKAAYLWETGLVIQKEKKQELFSPLFKTYVDKVHGASGYGKEFTKKEYQLFTYLKANEGNLCERDTIIESVWPENRDLGVSDWSIDRLVARLRAKLKAQGSVYQIITVITRGYKLIASNL
jgi:hypothetical protein